MALATSISSLVMDCLKLCFYSGLQRERASRTHAVCRAGAVHGTAKMYWRPTTFVCDEEGAFREDYQGLGVSVDCGNKGVSSSDKHLMLLIF